MQYQKRVQQLRSKQDQNQIAMSSYHTSTWRRNLRMKIAEEPGMINDYLDMGILFLKRGTISYHKREINFLPTTKQSIQAVISKVSINEAEQKNESLLLLN